MIFNETTADTSDDNAKFSTSANKQYLGFPTQKDTRVLRPTPRVVTRGTLETGVQFMRRKTLLTFLQAPTNQSITCSIQQRISAHNKIQTQTIWDKNKLELLLAVSVFRSCRYGRGGPAPLVRTARVSREGPTHEPPGFAQTAPDSPRKAHPGPDAGPCEVDPGPEAGPHKAGSCSETRSH